jgi:apolipoprotein N-acyltransferase
MKERPWIGAVASAVLLALGFAGLWPLVFVALIPWLISLRDTTPRQAWRRGYGFGLLFSLTQLWWLGDLAYKWTDSILIGLLPWLLASVLTAVYYGLLGRLIRSCCGLQALWAIPLVWAGMEVFRSYIPVLAFPWALLAEPLIAVPDLGAPAYYGTIYLASALVVAGNVVLLTRQRWLGVGALAVTFLLAGRHPDDSGMNPQTFSAGQPGVDMAFDADANEKLGPVVDQIFKETPRTDLLVLPEGIAQGGDTLPPKTPFHVPPNLSVVFGGQRGLGPVYQSAFGYGGGNWTYADKTRLVIFGEFVPGRDYFPFMASAFRLPGGDLSAGSKVSPVRAGRVRVGPLICFEALFPDLGLRQASQSQVLAVMSIDDWFAIPARERLAQAAQWRAIESGWPVVRAGSLGRTMIISPYGKILAEAPFGGRHVVTATPPRPRGPFGFAWIFPLVALGSLFGIPVWARLRRPATVEAVPNVEPETLE